MDEEEKKDDVLELSDSALDDVLDEEADEEDEPVDPLEAVDEFGADVDTHEKQWE
jgi:hypothetical protein